jgi:hypothetical protein
LSVPLHVNGKTIAPGQIVYLLDRFLQPAMPAPRTEEQDPEPVGAAS